MEKVNKGKKFIKMNRIIKWSIIGIFVLLYLMTSIVSTIHVIDFFRLSNPEWLAITLAIAFELGAAACLGAIIILDKTSRWLVWFLFVLITSMQMMGNMYFSFINLEDYFAWVELFGLEEEDSVFQKRILSFVSGGILPIVALGFIKSLVDYIRPSNKENIVENSIEEDLKEDSSQDSINELESVIKDIQEVNRDPHNEKKAKNVEEKIAKVIVKNPDLKNKLTEEIKKLDGEDKYTKGSKGTKRYGMSNEQN